ncbi:MAG: NEW3 domain-containing protein [Candidatus Diapherotrites archaeon]
MYRELLALVLLAAILQGASAAVTLSANTPSPVYQGESATVTVTASASGSSASSVTVTIGLPSGLSTSGSTSQTIASLSAGQSQSLSWTVTGDNASSGAYTITFTASGGATANTSTQLSVLTPPYIEVSDSSCPSSTANVGANLTVSFTLKNTGGGSTNAQADMSYSTSYFALKSGTDPWSQDINAGSQIALSYDFNANDTGARTITALITSSQNNPDDVTCTVTISAVAGDGRCSSGETDTGSGNGCATGYNCQSGTCTLISTSGAVCGNGTCETGEYCSTCHADCGLCSTAGGGSGGEETSETKTETILEKTFSKGMTGDELRAILENAGASETAILKAVAAVDKTKITRAFKVEKITDAGGKISYKTTITLTIENKSGKKMEKVKILETIPKSILKTLAEKDISTLLEFKIIKSDPVVEFSVDGIGKGGSAVVSYSIAKDVNSQAAESWENAVVAEFEEAVDLCEGITCKEYACKTGKCSPETGTCVYSNKEDWTACGKDGLCNNGVCEEPELLPLIEVTTPTPKQEATPPAAQQPAGKFDLIPVLAAAVLAAILAGAYFLWKGQGEKPKPAPAVEGKTGKKWSFRAPAHAK